MTSRHRWWERWPELLDGEKRALDAAGIQWQMDDASLARGVMRLNLQVPSEEGLLEMYVVYPDAYPYFRFQVHAPGLDLPIHQHPFERNLCLIGRRTHYWDVDDTAADVLMEQLPKLLVTARTEDVSAVSELEEQQAEPFSNYYSYQPSMLLIDSKWKISPNVRSGTLTIGMPWTGGELCDPLIRGAVLEVKDENGQVLFTADTSLHRAFPSKPLEARWARVDKPIRKDDVGEFLNELLNARPELRNAKPYHVKEGWLQVWGVLFPEQTAHRIEGEGWVFACALDRNRPQVSKPPRPHFKKPHPNPTRRRS